MDGSMKKTLFSLLLVFSLFLSACAAGVSATDATPTPYPTPVRKTFTVQRGDIVVEARLSGRVSPQAVTTVSFAMSGKVSDVYAQAGDTVKAGQLLAELAEAQQLKADASKTAVEIRRAEIALEIARLTLEKYKAENRPSYDVRAQELQVELAEMSYNDVLLSLGIDPESNQEDTLEAQVAMARVFAPADGMIISGVSVGRSVNPNSPAFVIGDGMQLEVVAQSDANKLDNEIREMFEGMTVQVSPDASPEIKLTGKIRQLPSPYGTGPSDDKNVYISLDQPASAGTYPVGDKVTVTIILASKTGVLWLPPDAIRAAGGRTFVIVNSPEGPKRIEVEVGIKTLEMVEIRSGLDEGQLVVAP
jgi:membrane fusion protein, macrolide-specific efflux system